MNVRPLWRAAPDSQKKDAANNAANRDRNRMLDFLSERFNEPVEIGLQLFTDCRAAWPDAMFSLEPALEICDSGFFFLRHFIAT